MLSYKVIIITNLKTNRSDYQYICMHKTLLTKKFVNKMIQYLKLNTIMIHEHLTYDFIKFWNISEIGLPLFSIEFSMTFTCWPVWLGKVPRPLLRSRPSGSCHWWWQSYHSHFLQPTSQTSCSLWVYSKGRSFAVNTKIKEICIIGIQLSTFQRYSNSKT